MECSGLNDLEDIGLDLFEQEESKQRINPRKALRKAKIVSREQKEQKVEEKVQVEGMVRSSPGTERIYVKTYGCSHNQSDGEYMSGLLAEQGYTLVQSLEESELVLINSCTVVNPSQDAFVSLLHKAEQSGRAVVVAGCVPQGDAALPDIAGVSVVGITQIDRVVEVVEETLKGNTVRLLEKKALPSLDLPKIRKNADIEIIPINAGCLGSCTYCKTVFARGKLISYAPEAIIEKVRSASAEGVKEIWLTSEDTGAYGLDRGSNIAQLLVALSEELELHPHLMVRMGMSNPPYLLAHLPTFARFLNHPRVYAFAHIPIQAAHDNVLAKMNREYTVADFRTVADYLLKHVPGITIATDIICGFAEGITSIDIETDEEFEATLDLINEYRFKIVNINQFYLRPGTPAASLKQLPSSVVKSRSQKMTHLFHSYNRHEYLVGTEQRVWINEVERFKGKDCLVGHTKNYTKVVFPYEETLKYQQVLVKIQKAFDWHVEGTIIEDKLSSILIPSLFLIEMKEEVEKCNEDFRAKKNARKKELNLERLQKRLNKENSLIPSVTSENNSCFEEHEKCHDCKCETKESKEKSCCGTNCSNTLLNVNANLKDPIIKTQILEENLQNISSKAEMVNKNYNNRYVIIALTFVILGILAIIFDF